MNSILTVRDLHISYGDQHAVLGVSFDIRPGEIFGLLGPNGAGKTSTLSAIEGLLIPRSGALVLNGTAYTEHNLPLIRSQIGVQLQSTSFQSELTISEIIRLYAGLYGVGMTETDITEVLEYMGLGQEKHKRFKEISGGQQQRVSLIIATIHSPALLLLDEPTTGLDPQSRRQLWAKIEQIRTSGRSIVLTTHSMEEAEAVCDRIAIIDHGKILVTGTPTELIEKYQNDPAVLSASRGRAVRLEDVFIGLTGENIRI